MATRSKTHILKIMTRLLLLWMKYPTLRLTQLIGNVFIDDIYYIEDENLIDQLEDAYNNVQDA